jgi:hypothetical protein
MKTIKTMFSEHPFIFLLLVSGVLSGIAEIVKASH